MTDWDGQFKKLYEEVSDSWIMLPLRIRGVGCELLRVSNRVSGKLGDTRDSRVLARKVGADLSDAPLIEEAVTALLEQGFLTLDADGALFVTNLAQSQADQRAKWREKKRNQRAVDAHSSPDASPSVPSCPPVSPPVPGTVPLSPREERRGEEKRQQPPTPFDGQAGGVADVAAVVESPRRMGRGFDVPDDDWMVIAPLPIPDQCKSVLIRWFIKHHLDGESRTPTEWRRSFRHWATRAWNERRAECLAESKVKPESDTSPVDLADELLRRHYS